MRQAYRQPNANCYRLTNGIRVTLQAEAGLAICAYPLRIVRVSSTAARLLQCCQDEHTCEELAAHLQLPRQRVQTLCTQLCAKGLLEAGPILPPATWPHVSIIIPTHNRANQLERCLRSLCTLQYPTASLEILIVDDASTDETTSMLQRFTKETTLPIRVLSHTTQQGVAICRNSGAEAAHSPLLAYIDSDCVASPMWLKDLVPVFQHAHVAAVGGMIRAYERESMLGRYEDVRSSLFMGNRPQQVSLSGPLQYLPTANFLVRRELWQQLGGFAPLSFGEDVDFCRRLLAHNAHILYVPHGIVYHDYRTQLPAFLRIRTSYASAEAALLQRHPEERRVLLLPPEQASFAALVVGGLWGCVMAYIGSRFIPRPPHPRVPARGTPTMDDEALVNSRGTLYGYPAAGGWARMISLFSLTTAFLLSLWGAWRRWQRVRQQRIPIGPLAVLRATIRGHLAYTYHLARHLTRYYTLPLLLVGIVLPPLLVLALMLMSIVIGVDYVRLRPDMRLGEYAWCAVLDDCAYEVGVVRGCIQHRTWKPLWPIIRRKLPIPADSSH
nr:mycofactocin biosynthesis glycosyltransferase MftF [Ktedonobacteraceae bacterium]